MTLHQPLVYALWKLPELLPSFAIHAPVFSRLLNGAGVLLLSALSALSALSYTLFSLYHAQI